MALPKRTWGGRSGVRRISWRVDKISNFSQSVCPWINNKKKSQPIVMVSVTYSHKTYPFYHFPEISLSLSLSLPLPLNDTGQRKHLIAVSTCVSSLSSILLPITIITNQKGKAGTKWMVCPLDIAPTLVSVSSTLITWSAHHHFFLSSDL